VILDDTDYVTEQFKLLRTLIFNFMRPEGLNTLQITGFGPGEGKSLIAANLAVSIALDSRQTTLLVDLDFRNPSVHCLFDLGEAAPGIASYFYGEAEIEDILVNPGIDKLTILPAGCPTFQAPELMGSAKMEALVKELKERYPDRFIIFDTPPMDGVPDALVFSQYVDALILVGRAGFTTRESVKRAGELVPREKVLGLVFNGYEVPGQAAKYGSKSR
jgi:capsular exopolysaccharide synthesis family protein